MVGENAVSSGIWELNVTSPHNDRSVFLRAYCLIVAMMGRLLGQPLWEAPDTKNCLMDWCNWCEIGMTEMTNTWWAKQKLVVSRRHGFFLSPLNLASQGAVMGLAPPHLVGGWAACHRCFFWFIFCLLLYCFAESSNPRNDFGPEPFAGSRVKGLPLTATRGNSMRIYEDFVARKACGRMLLPLLCL